MNLQHMHLIRHQTAGFTGTQDVLIHVHIHVTECDAILSWIHGYDEHLLQCMMNISSISCGMVPPAYAAHVPLIHTA